MSRLSRALVLVLLVVTIVGCAPAAPTAAPTQAPATQAPAEATQPPEATQAPEPTAAPTEPPATPAPKLSGEISVLGWNISPDNDKVLQDQAAEFEKTHPGTKINITFMPYDQYEQKLALLISAGTPPDAFYWSGDMQRYVKEGVCLPLDEYINADPVLSDPKQTRTEAFDLSKLDGQHVYLSQYGVLCGLQLYYNRDLFDKAGLKYPDENWTWDDFLAAAQKLTVKQGEDYTQWGCDLGYLPGWDGGWETLVWERGGKLMDTNFDPPKLYLDSPEVIDALQWMQDLTYKHQVTPSQAAQQSLAQAGGPFLSGKVGMVVDGCWMLSSYVKGGFKLGMSVVPKGPAGRVQPLWYAPGFVIAKASKNKDLAWEWCRWLAVDETANKMQASVGQNCGAAIVRKYDDLYASAWKPVPGGEACVKCLDPKTGYGNIYSAKWSEIWGNIISPEWDKFMQGKITAKQFSDAITTKVNDTLQAK